MSIIDYKFTTFPEIAVNQPVKLSTETPELLTVFYLNDKPANKISKPQKGSKSCIDGRSKEQ